MPRFLLMTVKGRLFLVGALLFCVCFAPLADAAGNGREKVLTISTIENEHTQAISKEVLREAYRKLGYTVRFAHLPGLRALEWANAGETDGDVVRIKGTEKKFPNLIPVPTPVIHFKGVAFTKNVEKDIKTWSDLKGFRIGIIRGIRYSEIHTKGLNPFKAHDMTHLFTLLDRGRIDIAVAVLEAGLIEVHNNFKDSGIHVIGSPLYVAPLYHFVNVKHKDLVNRLNQELAGMENSGEMEEIHKNTLQKLLDKQ
jgi:polar amino acid transport system substrate-binding protein